MANKPPKYRSEYDVGYGKPPKSGQFKPGQSGNPKGRRKKPKAPTDFDAEIFGVLNELVKITKNGQEEWQPKWKVALEQFINRAVSKSDYRSMQLILELVHRGEKSEVDEARQAELRQQFIDELDDKVDRKKAEGERYNKLAKAYEHATGRPYNEIDKLN